jgi:hypothetical protein
MTAILSSLFKQHCSVRVILAGILLLTVQLPEQAHAQISLPRLSSDTLIATAGFFRLHWSTDKSGPVELQQANNPSFARPTLRYRGPDRASVISGMPNGKWYYRVRTVDNQDAGPWSKTVMVTVAHHPLSRAFMFFVLGVIVFISTVVLILHGTRQTR